MNRLLIFLLLIIIGLPGCRIFEKSEPFVIPTEPNGLSASVTSPAVGEILLKGNVMKIRWSGFNAQTVNLELLKKGQYFRQVIAVKLNNAGSYDWVIPGTTTSSTSYQVKLTNSEDSSHFIYSEVFAIRD